MWNDVMQPIFFVKLKFQVFQRDSFILFSKFIMDTFNTVDLMGETVQ